MPVFKFFAAFAVLFASVTIMGKEYVRGRIDIRNSSRTIALTPGKEPGNGFTANAKWLKKNSKYYLYSHCKIPVDGYLEYEMSFTPDNSGEVSVILRGPYKKKKGKLVPVWVCWSDIIIEGAELPKTNKWNISPRHVIKEHGKPHFVVCFNSSATKKIKVVKGREVVIKGKVKRYNPPSFPIDLSRVVNMGFADEVAGDNKGGWSDQGGPARDMREIDLSKSDYAGIKFNIIDPAANHNKAVVTFDSKHAATGLKQITIGKVPEASKSCRYLYLLHTTCWNSKAEGENIAKISIKYTDGSLLELPIQAGVDVSDWSRAGALINGQAFVNKKTLLNEDDIYKALYFSKFDLGVNVKAKQIDSISFLSNGQVVWILLGATLSDRYVGIKAPRRVFREGNGWKAVKLDKLYVKEGTALDFSYLVKSEPAGSHGRVIVGKNGILAFADAPEKRIRFVTATSLLGGFVWIKDKKTRRAKLSELAKQIRIQGYNLVRFWVDRHILIKTADSLEFDPQRLDDLDFYVAELKKNGIYIFIDLAGYNLYQARNKKESTFQQRNIMKAKMFLGDKEIRRWWETGVINFLTHVNPYTGVAWKDETALMFVDFYNEQKMGMLFALVGKRETLPADSKKLLIQKWRQYLKTKYQDFSNLTNSWKGNLCSGLTFETVLLPEFPLKRLSKRSRMENDYVLFLMQLQQENMEWYLSIIKKTAYKGLCTGSNLIIGGLKDSAVRSQYCDIIIANNYFAHPSAFTRAGSRITQSSSLIKQAPIVRRLLRGRLWDRPFVITEWNHAFWNKYQHEAGLLNAAYFAFQGFDSVMTHSLTVVPPMKRGMSDFSTGLSPVGRANEFLVSCLFGRADVKISEHRIKVLIDKKYLLSGSNAASNISGDLTKLGLISGFGLDFTGWNKPSGAVSDPECDLTLSPDKGGSIKATGWVVNISENESGSHLTNKICEQLRKKGILKPANISNPEKGIFQTDTGEITIFSTERKVKVKTAMTEGVTLDKGNSESIGQLRVISTSEPALIALTSVDNKPLEESQRMVLVYSTYAVNSGMELSDDLVTLYNKGTLPVLMKTGVLNVQIKNPTRAKYKLFALAFDGTRRQSLEIKNFGDKLNISIDTNKLVDGPTPFFEIVRSDFVKNVK